jgi:hypothetical protein
LNKEKMFPTTFTDQELTAIYKKANGVVEGKNPPITTDKIFTAMRYMAALYQSLEAEKNLLLDVLVEITHHKGDLEEQRPRWEPIVKNELIKRSKE